MALIRRTRMRSILDRARRARRDGTTPPDGSRAVWPQPPPPEDSAPRRGWAGGGVGAKRMAKARPADAAGPAMGRYGLFTPSRGQWKFLDLNPAVDSLSDESSASLWVKSRT